ncbi:MAG: hypothetical protein Q9201_004477 [Fulgogasparrea decipioides]
MAKSSHLYPHFQASTTPTAKDTEIYAIHGGNGPPLLLLHGFPQTHLLWHKVAPELSKHYTLIIPDLRGYGDSSKPTTDPNNHSHYSKSAMAADCVALMDSRNYPTFYVCGHDRGARVAHSLCVNFPQRVKKCILLDICPTKAMYAATDRSLAQAYWHWFFLIQPAPFPEDAITAAAASSVFASKLLLHRDVHGEAYDAYAKQFTHWPTVHAMCEDYRASAKEDIEEQTADEAARKKIRCPLRVLWGTQGVVEKMFDARREWEKASEEGMVDDGICALDCGHFIPEERPEELVRHVVEFFRDSV